MKNTVQLNVRIPPLLRALLRARLRRDNLDRHGQLGLMVARALRLGLDVMRLHDAWKEHRWTDRAQQLQAIGDELMQTCGEEIDRGE